MVASPIAPGRNHNRDEVFTLEDYRNRYALYRLDPDLQDAHAAYPFLVTWDDHEVDNNYAGLTAEESATFQGGDFLIRRLNAYRVYGESMPLHPRVRMRGTSPGLNLTRSFRFGALANLYLLDTRQFRGDQPAGDNFGSTDPDSLALEPVLGETLLDAEGIRNPSATLLGQAQERWLARELRASRSTWNVLAQQVMVMPWNLQKAARASLAFDPTIPEALRPAILAAADRVDNLWNIDAWDGYPAARERLLGMLGALRPNNPVVITGDIHSAWAAQLLSDFANPGGADMLAAEFVATSISSTFLGTDPRPTHLIVRASLVDNPHIDYFNGLFRGYCLCDVDANRFQTTYRAVGDLASLGDPGELALVPFRETPVATDAVYEVAAGFNAPGSGQRLVESFRRPLPAPF